MPSRTRLPGPALAALRADIDTAYALYKDGVRHDIIAAQLSAKHGITITRWQVTSELSRQTDVVLERWRQRLPGGTEECS